MAPLVDATIDKMGTAYPTLIDERDLIVEILEREESGFARTLRTGWRSWKTLVARSRRAGPASFLVNSAFKLHDTHGFPIELTSEIVAESGLGVERDAFDQAMSAQRERARAGAKTLRKADDAQYRELIETAGATEFVGRDVSRYSLETTVVGVLEGRGRRERTLSWTRLPSTRSPVVRWATLVPSSPRRDVSTSSTPRTWRVDSSRTVVA